MQPFRTIASIPEFADACRALDGNDIYELFEFGLTQEMRDKIYNRFPSVGPEPCRDAMIQIGNIYGVQSLIDY